MSMVKKNVLVFPCGSEIGLELHRALGKAKEVVLYGASSMSDHGEFSYENYIPGIPYVTDSQFISSINRVVEENKIDYIIPAHDIILLELAKAVQSDILSCRVLTSSYETCKICCSKKRTHERFRDILPCPRLYKTLKDVSEWPVFIKPEVGCGSKGTAIATTQADAAYLLQKTEGLLVFEYLPGKEYTVDCFTERHGKLLFCGGRQRLRIVNGISVRTEPVKNPVFREIAETINQSMDFQGMWFFQVKEDRTGRLDLMEIAPRIAGAAALYRNLGMNFPLMALYDAEGYDVGILQNDYSIVYDRALESRFKIGLEYEHVYVDFDDCLLVEGKINLQMVAFLYQCVSHGIGITLLTRHDENIDQWLKKYRIGALFDEVIKMENGHLKSSYIKKTPAIFIDDSFLERKEVYETAGVTVFAPDAVESLLSTKVS